jgi:hypothetical protein
VVLLGTFALSPISAEVESFSRKHEMKPTKQAALAWIAERREIEQRDLWSAQLGLADVKSREAEFIASGGSPEIPSALRADGEEWVRASAEALEILAHLERLVLAGWDAH